MPNYTVSGHVVGNDGSPVVNAAITIHEIITLTGDPPQKGALVNTDINGRYTITWAESGAPAGQWDIFVRAKLAADVVESPLISDLSELESTVTVDLVLGTGEYEGRTEWERVAAKLAALLGATEPKDVPVDRLEWLSRRADVFPTHLAAYVQAHRLADGRTIKAGSCYAFLRVGLPADLPGLIRAGESAWSSALRAAWGRRLLPLPGAGSTLARDQELADEVAAMRELAVDAALTRMVAGVNQRHGGVEHRRVGRDVG